MKILIYGAGVIGSIYASKLYEASYDITLLARNERYEELKKNGIRLRNSLTGRQTVNVVPIIQQLNPDDHYDLIIVSVRMDQFGAILPVLKANTVCPLIMLLFNNPDNIDHITSELSDKHVIQGFPGAGGNIRDHLVEYMLISQQPTTIGEIKGDISPCIMECKRVFEKAGFPVSVSLDIRAWLSIHAVFISCITAAILQENGNSRQLGRKRDSIRIMVRSIREGFWACRSLGMPIRPVNLKVIFLIMPQWFSVLYWQRAMKGKTGVLAIAPHANAAKEEMKILARKIIDLVHTSKIPTPFLDDLLESFINDHKYVKTCRGQTNSRA